MLGKLARLLRLLGIDVAFIPNAADEAIVERARAEGRVILTRDRGLAASCAEAALVDADRPQDQLREVVRRWQLRTWFRPLTRCSRCNVPIRRVEPGAVADRVPRRTLEEAGELWCCDACGRVYWDGSHVRRMAGWMRALGATPDAEPNERPGRA